MARSELWLLLRGSADSGTVPMPVADRGRKLTKPSEPCRVQRSDVIGSNEQDARVRQQYLGAQLMSLTRLEDAHPVYWPIRSQLMGSVCASGAEYRYVKARRV